MLMKISNETKVGELTAIAVTLLILGFNFLKGRSVFKTGNFLYAKYPNAKGIMVSNPVYINGYQIGSVFDIENADRDLKSIIISIKLKSNYNIPNNSVATIKEGFLGSPSINIQLGNSTTYLRSGDTLLTSAKPGLLGQLGTKIDPISEQLSTTLHALDSVLNNINTIFDPHTKHNLQEVIANINKIAASLAISSISIQKMLDQQNGAFVQSMNNVNSFTKNMSDNNEKITQSLSHVEAATRQLSDADMKGTISELKTTIANLNVALNKINAGDGSLGLLLNDKQLYNNLNNTVRSANILMDDLRAHPKRYVNISIFGRKDKSGPLMVPLNDTSLQQQHK